MAGSRERQVGEWIQELKAVLLLVLSGNNVLTVSKDLPYCIARDMLVGPFYIHLNVRH